MVLRALTRMWRKILMRTGIRNLLITLAVVFASGALAADGGGYPAENEGSCGFPDPGFGVYDPWSENLNMGKILMPHKGGITSRNEFDVVIHFHGHQAIRKTLVKTAHGMFVVGIDMGVGSGVYQRAFTSPDVFPDLLDSIENAVAEHAHNKGAHIRKLALSSWSAGYGAIREILRQKASARVDSVVLIDGLHADYDDADTSGFRVEQLAPFVKFARRAAKRDRFMYVSHSTITPPGYVSSTETAHYLVKKLYGKVSKSEGYDGPLLSRYEQARIGNFLMRGYRGDGKSDHCAQIGVMAGVVAALETRWKTPVGMAVKPEPEALRSPAH
jgi:hypothetical protein